MVTIHQLFKNCRKVKKRRIKTPALQGCPQRRGICVRTFVVNPKKPNSAKRKVARLRVSTGFFVTASIPGEGHSIMEHTLIMIRGGRVKDLPGIKYRVIRGVLDVVGVEKRRSSRSKYGTKRPLISKVRFKN